MTHDDGDYMADGSGGGDREPLPRLDAYNTVAEVIGVLGNKKRLRTFQELAQGVPISEIHEQYEPSRSGVSNFVQDYVDAGLVEGHHGDYELTDWGNDVYETLLGLDEKAQQFERRRFEQFLEESSLSVEDQIELLESIQEE